MTSLAAWIGVDSRGPSSAYIASDSRLTWPGNLKWESGRKIFSCHTSPDLFGYCGDAVFPCHALSSVIQMIDGGSVFGRDDTAAEKFDRVSALLKSSFSTYPTEIGMAFTIVHWSRTGAGSRSTFELRTLTWDIVNGWQVKQFALPARSALILSVGSGHATITTMNHAWEKTAVGGTSRAVFGAFCDALESGSDPYTGGAPQLVGLYRTGTARTFGIIYRGKAYLNGIPVGLLENAEAFEWRNCLFERCDPNTLARLLEAQPQPRPKFPS
jgi:hypothetical protein